MRRLTLFFFLPFLLFSKNIEKRLTDLEKQMVEVSMETPRGSLGARFASMAVVDGCGLAISADLLYWQAKVGGTEFAYSSNDSIAPMPIRGEIQAQHFNWNFGFRFSVSYLTPEEGFELALRYLWYDSSNPTATAKNQPSFLYLLKSPILFNMGQAAKSRTKLGYHSLDFELARNYFVSAQLNFRPHVGLKSAWIDQDQWVRYYDVIAAPEYGIVEIHNKDHVRFWGMGGEMGLDSMWYLGQDFSLFFESHGALLWGNFKTSLVHNIGSVDGEYDTSNLSINLSGNRHMFSPFMSLYSGLAWDHAFKENRARIAFFLGYEVQYFWRQNQAFTANGLARVGDQATAVRLTRIAEDNSFYGLTLRGQIDF